MVTPSIFKRFFSTLFLILGFVICLTYSIPAFADIPIGQVVWVKGSVSAVAPDNKERPLKRSDFIYEHETLKTSKDGSGQVVFSDKGLMSLASDTVIKIDEYKFTKDGKPSENKFVSNLVKGGLREVTGAISKGHPENFQLKTPVATIGVRGTVLTISYEEKIKKLAAGVELGEITVKNNKGVIILNPKTEPYANVAYDVAPLATKIRPSTLEKVPPIQPAVVTPQFEKAVAMSASKTTPAATTTTNTNTSVPASTGAKPASTTGPKGGGGGGCGNLTIGG